VVGAPCSWGLAEAIVDIRVHVSLCHPHLKTFHSFLPHAHSVLVRAKENVDHILHHVRAAQAFVVFPELASSASSSYRSRRIH